MSLLNAVLCTVFPGHPAGPILPSWLWFRPDPLPTPQIPARVSGHESQTGGESKGLERHQDLSRQKGNFVLHVILSQYRSDQQQSIY